MSPKNTVQESDVDWDESFHELRLTDHSGLPRFSSYHSKAATVHLQAQELKRLINESGQPVFYVPDVFYTPDFHSDRGEWMTEEYISESKIAFDLRNEG